MLNSWSMVKRMSEQLSERLWGNDPVQLYAIADLDASMKLTCIWVALGPDRLAIAGENDRGEFEIDSIELSQIKSVKETPGLSCTTLTLFGAPGQPPLTTLRYTHRQRRSMENIKFIIEQRIEGNTVELTDEPDCVYVDSVTHSIREAQASVASNKLAVVWRLIGYLKPYRTRVVLGMLGAAVITMVSLLPAYLTGYVIDKVIKPFQEGVIDYTTALNIAWVIMGGLALIYIVRVACMWVRLRSMSILGELVAGDLRRDLYDHMQRLSLSFFSSKLTGVPKNRVEDSRLYFLKP